MLGCHCGLGRLSGLTGLVDRRQRRARDSPARSCPCDQVFAYSNACPSSRFPGHAYFTTRLLSGCARFRLRRQAPPTARPVWSAGLPLTRRRRGVRAVFAGLRPEPPAAGGTGRSPAKSRADTHSIIRMQPSWRDQGWGTVQIFTAFSREASSLRLGLNSCPT
jgi:hypothetical protein